MDFGCIFSLVITTLMQALFIVGVGFIVSLNRDMEELVTKEQEENLAIVTTPNSSVTSLNWNFEGSLTPLKVNIKFEKWKSSG